jgi:hypothetical protein
MEVTWLAAQTRSTSLRCVESETGMRLGCPTQVYDRAARGIVQGIFQGYNGTIFAYGQVRLDS